MQPPPTTVPAQRADFTWQMSFTPHEKCVRLVRRQVQRALGRWGYAEDDVAAAVLVCSELAANAVQHARVPREPFDVLVAATGRECLIEVSDRSASPPRRADPGADDERGRGLRLVAAVASEVGHRLREPQGKTVWARLSFGRLPTAGEHGEPCSGSTMDAQADQVSV
ncbi:ATP-binding protein [Streptomyces sp. 8N616]|uniref:ATP-binding protein n=1 Tax=Streptomyces sp. 8N616 TaxID=3457414 RepID=UPI003FD048A0